MKRQYLEGLYAVAEGAPGLPSLGFAGYEPKLSAKGSWDGAAGSLLPFTRGEASPRSEKAKGTGPGPRES